MRRAAAGGDANAQAQAQAALERTAAGRHREIGLVGRILRRVEVVDHEQPARDEHAVHGREELLVGHAEVHEELRIGLEHGPVSFVEDHPEADHAGADAVALSHAEMILLRKMPGKTRIVDLT